MMDLALLTRGLNVAYSGFTGTVASSSRYSVVEIQAPSTRDLFITSVVILSGVNAYLEKGSSTFVTTSPSVVAPDSRSNFASKLSALGSGSSGSSSTDPNTTGLIIPASGVVEVLPVPLIVEAGEFIAMISESKNAAVRYGFRWLEIVTS